MGIMTASVMSYMETPKRRRVYLNIYTIRDKLNKLFKFNDAGLMVLEEYKWMFFNEIAHGEVPDDEETKHLLANLYNRMVMKVWDQITHMVLEEIKIEKNDQKRKPNGANPPN